MIRHRLLPEVALIAALLLAGPLSVAQAQSKAQGKAAKPEVSAPASAPAVSLDPACTTTRSRSADGRIGYFRNCPDSPDMVSFRSGSCRMGDAIGNGQSYERPAHDVTVKPFAIGRYEVTRGEWQACVAAGSQ